MLTAEIVHHYFPQLVALHNYSPANSTTQKIENWRALNSMEIIYFYAKPMSANEPVNILHCMYAYAVIHNGNTHTSIIYICLSHLSFFIERESVLQIEFLSA